MQTLDIPIEIRSVLREFYTFEVTTVNRRVKPITTVITCQDLIFLCKPMNDSFPLGYVGSKPNDQQQRLTVTM